MMLTTSEEQIDQDMMMATSMEDPSILDLIKKESMTLANQFEEIDLKELHGPIHHGKYTG